MDLSIRPSSETNQRPILEHLAPNSTSSNEELPVVGDLVLEVATEDGDLGVVSCAQGLDVRLSWEGVRERLERVEVHVLYHRVELCTDGFEYFLRDEPADDGIGGCDVSDCLERELLRDLFVDFLVSGDRLSQGNHGLCVLCVARSRVSPIFFHEGGEGLEASVKSRRTVELSKVGKEEFGRLD